VISISSLSGFSKNTAVTLGGAIYAIQSSKIIISGSSFSENQAYSEGGAIYLLNCDSTSTLASSNFNKNTANG